MSAPTVTVQLTQRHDYQFEVSYGGSVPPLLTDEPVPLGAGQGPSPVQLLATAVGNCLSDSLLFALRKFKQQPEPLSAAVMAEVGRNPEGRLRVLRIQVDLQLGVPADSIEHLDRVLASFESYCTVTQSVAGAIPVEVRVRDSLGRSLKPGAGG